jgi:hypothetical protein
MKLLLKVILALSLVQPFGSAAQSLDLQVLGNAGADVSTSNASLYFTVGEMCIQAQTNSNLYWGVGFQQAIETNAVSAAPSIETAPFSLRIYPNPTANWITLECDQPALAQLHQADGRIASESIVATHQTQISLAGYPAGFYFLKVLAMDGSWRQTLPLIHTGQ